MLRRLLLALPLALAGTSASAADGSPYGDTLVFAAYRNGQAIGSHALTFRRDGGRCLVNTSIDFAVRAMGVVVYRYSHRGQEVWNRGAFQVLSTRTDDNGKKYAVHAQRAAKGIVVEREGPNSVLQASSNDEELQRPEIVRQTLPPNVLPTTHWNIAQVRQAALLNTQLGTLDHIQVTTAAREMARTASGAVAATRYDYTGDLRFSQWFDDRNRWVKASFQASDGSTIEYILQE